MIEPALFFALGFLGASFLLLLFAPAFGRRARRLERRRLEASLPMSMNELQAEKDRIRADAAVTIRRLELDAKAARDRAAEHAIAIGRAKEDARLLKEESARRQTVLQTLEAERDDLRAALGEAQARAKALEARTAELDEVLRKRQEELAELGRLYDDASFSSASRQIEMVGRESDIDRLHGELQARGREIDRLRRELQAQAEERERVAAELVQSRSERMTLEAELADASARASGLFSTLSGDTAQTLARITAERDRLETRVAALMRENKKIRESQAAAAPAGPARPDDPGGLAEQMAAFAAEFVDLVARLEGPDGAVDRILAATPPSEDGPAPSLADRIRALRARSARAAPPSLPEAEARAAQSL